MNTNDPILENDQIKKETQFASSVWTETNVDSRWKSIIKLLFGSMWAYNCRNKNAIPD